MASIISAGTTSGTSLNLSGDTSGVLQLASNGSTTALTIDTSQKVGIGTASPAEKLNVVTSSGSVYTNITNGTGQVYVGVLGTNLGYFGTVSNHAQTFYTNNTERMRLDSAGRLLFGTTATSPATADAYGITLGGNTDGNYYAGVIQASSNGGASLLLNRGSDNGNVALFYRSAVNVGNIAVTGSATSYNSGSDYRLKNDIQPITNALQKVALLKPSKWTWKADNTYGDGFVAHELAEICPHAVTGEKDAMETYKDDEGNEQTRISPQSVDTSFLVATLTAAIQELKAELDATKAEVQALKGVA